MKTITRKTKVAEYRRSGRLGGAGFRLGVIVPVTVCVLTVSFASGQTTWQGGPGGSWDDPLNWSAGAPATYVGYDEEGNIAVPGGLARIANHDVVEIASGLAEATQVEVREGTLNLAGGELQLKGWNAARDGLTPLLSVGASGGETAWLNITNGSKFQGFRRYGGTDYAGAYLDIGRGAGLRGAALIAGNATSVEAASIQVGESLGYGRLTIDLGAEVKAGFSLGGRGGDAEVTIQGGATVTGTFDIGGSQGAGRLDPAQPVGSGRVIVSGLGTVVNPQNAPDRVPALTFLNLGHNGDNGHLRVENGAQVNAGILQMGFNGEALNVPGGEGTVVVTGEGSQLNIVPTETTFNGAPYLMGGQARVGYADKATVVVSDRGTFRVVESGGGGNSGIIQHIILGVENSNSWGVLYEGHGVLQIGEGGRAGYVVAEQVLTGRGKGEILFNHNEQDYEFAPDIAPASTVNASGSNTRGTEVRAMAGRTVLIGSNSYFGKTLIENGAVLAAGSGSALGRSEVVVDGGGTLEIGAGVDTLVLKNNLSFEANSLFKFTVALDPNALEILRVDDEAVDFWADPGESVTYFDLSLPAGFDLHRDYQWTFLRATDGVYGFLESATVVNRAGWSVIQVDDYSLALSYTAVPEPSVLGLLGAGWAAAVFFRKRGRKKERS